jgi:hypothetical protein
MGDENYDALYIKFNDINVIAFIPSGAPSSLCVCMPLARRWRAGYRSRTYCTVMVTSKVSL